MDLYYRQSILDIITDKYIQMIYIKKLWIILPKKVTLYNRRNILDIITKKYNKIKI